MTIHDMQNLNRATISYISANIVPGMSLHTVRQLCEDYLLSHGADSFWYWDIGAFVFKGNETTISVSGRNYHTSDVFIEDNDLITIDLSPQNNCIWGDLARTIVLEDGVVVPDIHQVKNKEWRSGLLMQQRLHAEMLSFVTPETTFEQLYIHINAFISANGYINLDFLGNLGHSIVDDKNKRIYIERGNQKKLSDVDAFTFEPHISIPHSLYGFKFENIYCFQNNALTEL